MLALLLIVMNFLGETVKLGFTAMFWPETMLEIAENIMLVVERHDIRDNYMLYYLRDTAS
jgi:hypothetical protein